MKKSSLLFTFQFALGYSGMQAMDGGAMNAAWFYDEQHPCKSANQMHQDKEWKKAAEEYEKFLLQGAGNEYDQEMARLNMAACIMAQGLPSKDWGSFDALVGIDKKQRISRELLADQKELKELVEQPDQKDTKKILVRTDKVGIGDIFHFLKAAVTLKKRTGWDIAVSVRPFLICALTDAAKDYKLNLISEQEAQPRVDYVTHIIGLLGHLEMSPASTNPEKVAFTASEKAAHAVYTKVSPVLDKGGKIVVVFLGENRQATLIGGKQLPRDPKKHGRHLSSAPFVELLKSHKTLTLMDCSTKESRVAVERGQEDQCMTLPDGDQPFDTIVALARIMSAKKGIITLGADNGPTNVFARALDNDAQNRMAFIIPNSGEYDMRMEGNGLKYKHMISNCWVYKCTTPDDQTKVIALAYKDMSPE